MTAYSTISDILSSGSADIVELGTSLESELPTLHSSAANTAAFTKSTSGFTAIHTLPSVPIEADDIITLLSMISVSAGNLSDVWQLTHSLNGTRKGSDEYAFYTAPVVNTSGRQQAITVVTVWKDQAAGNVDISLDVAPQSGPSGTFYARPYITHVFRQKRR